MSNRTLLLPGLEVVQDARSLYGDPRLVHIDCLSRFPDTVVIGMRREMERLELAGIPAFADGRRVWTANGSYFIELNGRPSRFLTSLVDFDARARHAARRMDERSGFSFNRCFRDRYLKEDQNYA